MNYILDNHGIPVAEPDIIKWAKWFETANRKVAEEAIGDSQVSTVFLGIDHSFHGGAPVLWETIVFGGKFDQEQERCSGLREEAEAMHARMVETVRSA